MTYLPVILVVLLTLAFAHETIEDYIDASVDSPPRSFPHGNGGRSPHGVVGPQLSARPPHGVVGPQVPGGPPKRPKNFKSVQELHNYLEALRDYYAVLGRPR